MTNFNSTNLFKKLSTSDKNILGVGYGLKSVRGSLTKERAIVVLVRKKTNQLRSQDILPRKINGVSTDIIEVGDLKLLTDNRQKLIRPAVPGISMAHYKVSAGTFGAVVRDKSTKKLLILSNNHVLANATNGKDDKANIGDSILQPGFFDGVEGNSLIANLERFVPLNRNIGKSTCIIATLFETLINKALDIFRPNYQVHLLRTNELVNLIDGAVAAPLSEDLISPEVLECGKILGTTTATPGMIIKKSGRTSGLTHSVIIATDLTVRVEVNEFEYAIFTDQILAGPMSSPGDSGSIVLSTDNHAIGLLFAGSDQATMINKMSNVLELLNVEFII